MAKKIPVLETKKDFYEFFKAIPEEKWTKGAFVNRDSYCALGHLGVRAGSFGSSSTPLYQWENSKNGKNFSALGGSGDGLMDANDSGYAKYDEPKKAVLAYVKNLEAPAKTKVKAKKKSKLSKKKKKSN